MYESQYDRFQSRRAENLDPNGLPPTLVEAIAEYLRPGQTPAGKERRLQRIGTILAHLDGAGRRVAVAIREGDEVIEIRTGASS